MTQQHRQHHRETSMMLGVGILLVVVTVVFFGFTLALEQKSRQQVRLKAVRRQLQQAQHQTESQATMPEDKKLKQQASVLAGSFLSEGTTGIQERLEIVANETGVKLTFMPALAPEQPKEPLPGFAGCYEEIPIVATLEGRYRNLADFFKRAGQLSTPLVSLGSAVISPAEISGGPVQLKARTVFRAYRWVPKALPKAVPPALQTAAPETATPQSPASQEPIQHDPFDARWIGNARTKGIELGGILSDPQKPSCILNGEVVQIGAVVKGYTVVAIEQNAVLLRGEDEQVLSLS